jgi:hypothetical protein
MYTMKFFCTNCNQEFEIKSPSKKEYKDYLLGSCWKYMSYCPVCGQESDEKRVPKQQKLSVAQSPSCDGNCGSCGN